MMEVLVTDCGDDVLLGTDFLKAAEVAIDFGTSGLTCFGQPVESSTRGGTVCRCVINGPDDFEGQLNEEVMPFLEQTKGDDSGPDLSHLSCDDQRKLKVVLDKSDVLSTGGHWTAGECVCGHSPHRVEGGAAEEEAVSCSSRSAADSRRADPGHAGEGGDP